jgi:hypothetical protein
MLEKLNPVELEIYEISVINKNSIGILPIELLELQVRIDGVQQPKQSKQQDSSMHKLD